MVRESRVMRSIKDLAVKQYFILNGKQYKVADKSFCFKHGAI